MNVVQVERVHACACVFRERLLWNECVFFYSNSKFTELVHICPDESPEFIIDSSFRIILVIYLEEKLLKYLNILMCDNFKTNNIE